MTVSFADGAVNPAVVMPGGVRVEPDEEDAGLDLAEHSETGYAFAER